MFVTEEEARTKWCHQANANAAPHMRCCASECMAWRRAIPPRDGWQDEFAAAIVAGMLIHAIKIHRNETGVGLKESKDYVEAVRDGREPMPKAEKRVLGYCGLAGEPR